jgi:DNA polymerase I
VQRATPMSAPRVFLIDGSSQMYRAYHAMRGSGLTGPGGKSTHAVYIFVTMLRKLMTDHHPEFIAASFDLAGPTFRSEMATDYKANRAPMPPDLAEQIPWVHEACEALGVPILTSQRFEADDVIGTLASKAVDAGFEVAIVTGDKDFFQLVHDGIKVYNPKDDGAWFDADAVKEKFGVRPDQVVDVLALMGDTIDNIKGVPGIGEKGARDLIANYGSLEALLDHASEVSNKRYREGLLGHTDAARQSRELAKIRTDVPIEFDPNAVRHRGASRERCFELFTRLGFRSLVLEYAPTADTIGKDYAIINSLDELRALVADLKSAGRVGIRVLPDAPSAMRAAIVGISFSTGRRQARYVPLAVRVTGGDLFGAHTDDADRPGLDRDAALAMLRPVLEDDAVRKVGHDLKFDAIMLARQGITLRGLDTDVMIAGYLLEANYAHPLEDLAIEHLGYKALKDEDVCGRGVKALSFASIPVERALDYAGERADLSLQLAGKLDELVTREALQRVYDELELPLIPVLVDIERAGVRIDGQALAAQAARIDDELSRRAKKIYELSGEEFNINSPKKLSEILFDRLGMRTETIRRTTKTKAQSTAFEVLEELALTHELPKLILEWRGLQKLKGTYIDALPALVNPDTGRVHTCFNQAVAATGRLSSSDPNLQNIPIRTEIGRDIRRAFVAESGHVLISADYSQIELRVLAHLAGEQALIDAFQKGEDIHDRTALKVFGTSSGLSPHELRRRAKIINYALLYGKQAFTLARDIGVPRQEAQAFIDAYFAGFPAVRKFIDDLLVQARETGVVTTMFGRRRLVPDLNNRNYQLRGEAERKAVNFPIQGTAADILKRAMIDVHAALQKVANRRARMILTVHDELLFETPTAAADETAATVRSLMEHAVTLNVPLEVDVGIGENWKEAK